MEIELIDTWVFEPGYTETERRRIAGKLDQPYLRWLQTTFETLLRVQEVNPAQPYVLTTFTGKLSVKVHYLFMVVLCKSEPSKAIAAIGSGDYVRLQLAHVRRQIKEQSERPGVCATFVEQHPGGHRD
jgi:hypothetical protein